MLTTATERSGGASGARSGEPKMPAAMSDEDLINALAQYLDLEPLEKQALLERPDVRSRASSLVELLEMKVMAARTPSVSHVAH
jgi:Lon protease-like protein